MSGMTYRRKEWTYRVENIPSATDEDQLIHKFSAEDQPFIRVRSIAPAINPKRDQLTATVSFAPEDGVERVPKCLDNELSVDGEFYGFTPLNTPDEPVVADLIAVTGLAGHAVGSWCSSPDHMWLREELPKDLNNVAVFIYGYYSEVQNAQSRNIISDHANEFVEKLRALRTFRQSQSRPHIFIGHSLGGLLIKEALCMLRPSISPDALKVLCAIFLGTPHRGLNTEALKELVARQPSQTIVDELGYGSPTLRALNEQFSRVFNQCNIMTFYEQIPTATVTMDATGNWRRNGPPELMVTYDSAVLGLINERKNPCQANHSTIAKLDSSQAGIYPIIISYLMQALLGNLDFGHQKNKKPKSAQKSRQGSKNSPAPSALPLPREPRSLTPSQSRYKPLSISYTGMPLSALYVDRPILMQSIEENMLPLQPDRQQIVVLYGLGGSGKSQLAKQYTAIHRSDYSAIFWITATSEQLLNTNLALIAEQIPLRKALDGSLRLPRDEQSINLATAAVLSWLNEPDNTDWLIVFDGLDHQDLDDGVLTPEDSDFDAFPYIPLGPGNIIITTRLANLATNFGALDVEVEAMSKDEGLTLLSSISKRPLGEEGAEAVVSRLAGHPLALTQAARYMLGTKKDALQYLSEFDRNFRSSIGRKLGKREYSNGSLETAFRLSYQALRSRKPDAAALLQLLGALDWSNIFWKMFHYRHASDPDLPRNAPDPLPSSVPDLNPNWLRDIGADEVQFDDCIEALNSFSFVTRNESLGSISLHRLLRDWLALSWDTEDRDQFVRTAATLVTAYVTQTTKARHQYEHWHRMTGHVDRLFDLYDPQKEPFLLDYATLLPLAGMCHYRGDYTRTKILLRTIYMRLDKHFGTSSEKAVKAKVELSPLGSIWMKTDENILQLEKLKQELENGTLDDKTKAMLKFRVSKSLTEALSEDPKLLPAAVELSSQTLDDVKAQKLPQSYVDGALLLQGRASLLAGNYDLALQCTRAVFESASVRAKRGSSRQLEVVPILLQLGMVLARAAKGSPSEARSLLLEALRTYETEYGPAHENTLAAAHQMNLCTLRVRNRYDSGLRSVRLRWSMALNAARTAVINRVRVSPEYENLVRYISYYRETTRKSGTSTGSTGTVVSGSVPTHSLLSYARYLAKKAKNARPAMERLLEESHY